MEEVKYKLKELKGLIEIRNELKRIYEIWSRKENIRKLVEEKAKQQRGKVDVKDPEIVGRFHPKDNQKDFFELYATAYGLSFDGKVLEGFPGEIYKIVTVKGKEIQPITTEEIEKVERILKEKPITVYNDGEIVGRFPEDYNVNRVKEIFLKIGEEEEDFLAIDEGNALIYIPKLDKKMLGDEIIRKIGQTYSSDVSIGQKIWLKPEEQKEIASEALKAGLSISGDEAFSLLKRVFENDKKSNLDKKL